MSKLKVATHSRGHNKTNVAYLSSGWQNQWLTPKELFDWVRAGKAWSGTHFVDGKRCEANASGSNAIVFDFDGELQLDDFWTTQTAMQWCAFTYTSFSSTPEVNRFRAVFPIEGVPLQSSWEHKAVYQFIALKLMGELGIEFKDDCGSKPERLWFGNTDAEMHLNDGACMPASVASSIEIPPEPVYEYAGQSGITDLDVRRCIWLLANAIPPSEDEEYNEVYVPVTAACAAIGTQMVDAWVDWVSRGHHGDKASNMNPQLKWRGLGKRSGPASLYAMAKRLDPNWRKKLPPELQFGGAGNSQEIFEAFLSGTMHCAPKRLFVS